MKLMRKFILAAAALVALANIAEASALYWKVEKVPASDIAQSALNPYMFYAFDDSVSYNNKTGLDAVKNMLTDKCTLTDYALNWRAITDSTSGFVTQKARSLDKGTSLTTFMVILNSTYDKATNYMVAHSNLDGESEDYKITITGDFNNVVQYANFGSQANNTWTSISSLTVPEPTSGVLLLVGVAALALRRKNAA